MTDHWLMAAGLYPARLLRWVVRAIETACDLWTDEGPPTMTDPLTELLDGARAVHLDPDNILIIKLPRTLYSPDQVEALRRALPPGRHFLVVTGEVSVSVDDPRFGALL